MFKSQFGSALQRLFCMVALVLCFSGLAHAQQQQVLSLTAQSPMLEGADATFRVTLSSPATQRLTFFFGTSSGSGPTGAREFPEGPFDADFNGVSTNGDYTIEAGETQVNIRVPTFQDNSYEFDEEFNAFISNARFNGQFAGNVTFGQRSAVQTIINDDSPPDVTLSTPDPILEGDSLNRQRQNYNFTVNIGDTQLDPNREILGRPITLAFTTVDGTATSNGVNPGQNDFVPASSDVVQVPAGTRQFQYTVIVNGDDVYEGDENFTLRVEFSPPMANKAPSTAVGNIRDNDLPTYSIDPADPAARTTVEEGQSLAFVIRLLDRQGNEIPALSDITFNYSVQDVTATRGTDFTDPNNGSFTIPRNTSRFLLEFPTIDDNIIEQTETFRFVVRDAVGTRAPEGNGANSGTGTILDTADNNVGTVFTIQNATVDEGTGGTNSIEFTVRLTRASNQPISVSYDTQPLADGDSRARATAGSDYTAVTGRVVFAPNITTATFTVPITTDSINELDESFRVRLFNPTNAGFPNSAEEVFATATIRDDDSAGVLTVNSAGINVAENVSGSVVNVVVNFTPTEGVTQARPVTVNFTTLPDTAQQDGQRDYFGKAGTLTFRPGTTRQVIPIEIINDNIREGNESFTVRLSNPDGATLGVPSEARVIIQDDDPLPTVRVLPAAPIREDGGTKNFVVAVEGRSQAPITVNYAFADGTATKGLDYEMVEGQSGSLTFNLGGPVSFFVSARILDDNIAEGNETFSLVLSKDPEDNTFNLPQESATSTVIIAENDANPTLRISDAQVEEGNTGSLATGNELVFPVTLSRPSSRPVTFSYATLNLRQSNCTPANGCDVTSDADYAVARNVVVTIAPGETTAEIRVRVAPDTLNEYNDQFQLVSRALTNASPAVYADPNTGNQRFGTSAFGTIINDDAGGNITIAPPVTPEGAAITNGIAEGYNRGPAQRVGDAANFVVTLPAPAGRTVTVTYNVSAGSSDGFDVQDLTTGPGRGKITFFSGDTTRTISLRAIADNKVEGPESLRVVLSINDNNGPNSYTAFNAVSATTIQDRTPSVNTVMPQIGFPAYGTVAATRVVIGGGQLRTDGNPRVDAVLFNDVSVGRGGIQYLSDNAIAVSVPDTAKTGPLSLRLVDGSFVRTMGRTPRDETVAPQIPDFVVQPVITGFSPTAGVVNATTVTLTGRNFLDGNNPVTAVQFTGASVQVKQGATVINDNRIDVKVPGGATNGPIRIVSARGGVGPASQGSFAIVGAIPGGIRLGDNPDRNAIVEGSTGKINQPVRNFNGTGDNAFHRPYQFFINPARQNGGVNNGAALPVTNITVRFQITASAQGEEGRLPDIAVRTDLVNAGRPTLLVGSSGGDGTIDVNLDGRFNPNNPIEVAIVDAGTDEVPPIIGGTPANVTVTASIIESDSRSFFPITPENQGASIRVDRIEPVDNANQTAIAFGSGTRANFSVPFAVNNTNSVPIASVFNTPPEVNGQRRYTILRLDVANQRNNLSNLDGKEGAAFVKVDDNGRLERGIGYRLVVANNVTVQLNTKGTGLVVPAGDTFSYNLTRNVVFAGSTNTQGNSTNGYNFIGFPLDPAAVSSIDFNAGTVIFNGVERSVPDAAAAGLINSRLFTLDAQGQLVPANTTTISPFQAYFVQIFRDNLTLRLKK